MATDQKTTDEVIVDLDALAEQVGRVAAHEFAASKDVYKPRLLDWAKGLAALSDEDLEAQTRSAIYSSSLAASFRGNWEHDHFKASACHHEADRRKAATHATECTASTLYESAYNSVVIQAGHPNLARDLRPCTCEPTSALARDEAAADA